MEKRIVVWSVDEHKFLKIEVGDRYTSCIDNACEFDTLEDAQLYVSNNIPGDTVVYLDRIWSE